MGMRCLPSRRFLRLGGGSAFVAPYDSIKTDITGAWSFRRLFTSYVGKCCKVRRSSDNVELDIGFTAAGDFDSAAFTAHVGGGSGYIVTFYDQSGNGYNMAQSTTTIQPEVILAAQNGRPASRHAAATLHRMSAGTVSAFNFMHQTGGTIACAQKVNNTASEKWLFGNNYTASTGGFWLTRSGGEQVNFLGSRCSTPADPTNDSSWSVNHSTAANTSAHNLFMICDPANGTASLRETGYENNVQLAASNTKTGTPKSENAPTALFWGGRNPASLSWDGDCYEMMFWTGQKTGYQATYYASAKSYWGTP